VGRVLGAASHAEHRADHRPVPHGDGEHRCASARSATFRRRRRCRRRPRRRRPLTTLDLPRATRVVAVEGFGRRAGDVRAHAELSLDAAGPALGSLMGRPTSCGAVDGCGSRAPGIARRGSARAPSESRAATSTSSSIAPACRARTFEAAGTLDKGALVAQAATALADGGALLSGGASNVSDDAAYQGATRYDADGKELGRPRLLITGPRRPYGDALARRARALAGGCKTFAAGVCNAVNTTELYDPDGDSFAPGPPLLHARFGHDAVLRGDGTVLLVGGGAGCRRGGRSQRVSQLRRRPGQRPRRAAGHRLVLVASATAAPSAVVALWLSPSETPLGWRRSEMRGAPRR